jgi:hypothetical protein
MEWETFYLGIVTILFLAILVLWYFALGFYYKAYECSIDPNIWCWNDFTCNVACGTNDIPCGTSVSVSASCYDLTSPSLPECLYGPTTNLATQCLSSNDSDNCTCPVPLDNDANNCFEGCPFGTKNVTNSECKIVK